MIRGLVVTFGRLFAPLFRRKADFSSVEKICVFKTGAMGDVLMSTPFISALRKRFPNATIDYWTGNWATVVLQGNPNVDHIYPFDPKITYGNYRENLPKLLDLAKQIRLQKYDLMFSLDKSYLNNCFGRYLCRPRFHIGFNRHGEGFANDLSISYSTDVRKHEIKYYTDLAKAVDASVNDTAPLELYLTKEHEDFADAFLEKHKLDSTKLVGIGPSGGNPGQDITGRLWPKERFEQIARSLVENGYTPLFLVGPADYATYEPIAKAVKGVIAKTPTILHAAALLKYCRLFVCIDSGLMHIASAVHTPCVSIFGMSDPIRKAPLGKDNSYVWHPIACQEAEVFGVYNDDLRLNISRVQVSEVLDAVHRLLKQKTR